MRTTVDIPDTTYRLLKTRAAAEGGTVKQLLLRGAEVVLREPVKKKVPKVRKFLVDDGDGSDSDGYKKKRKRKPAATTKLGSKPTRKRGRDDDD
mgnify:CR=1 FL=1